jgi:cytosolic iron-sulfur protein assembly protein CIAO1
VLATGSFDATAGIWKRWEQGTGAVNAGAEIDFTSGLAGGKVEDDEEDDEWRFAVVLEGHDSEIKSLAFSTTSPLLATCSRDKSVWIWEELEEDNEYETVAVLTDHEGDVKCVAWHPGEQLLASASYDDNVRLWREDVDDWACCALLSGHGGTVWWVEFEGDEQVGKISGGSGSNGEQKALAEKREKAGPRLLSCSDDHTIRIWRRIPKDKTESSGQRLPSIWKNTGFEEDWVEETRLPAVHERSVYAVSWSKKTGRVASTGSDGKIVVYEERWRGSEANGDVKMADGDVVADGQRPALAETEWVILADIDSAHDVFEVNHITWAPRADKDKQYDGEEVLISTGDDGDVKVWTFDP